MKLFVYGTLMEGLYNNYLLGAAKKVGAAKTTPGWKLVTGPGRGYPAMVRGGEGVVWGEVYEMDEYGADLRAITELEVAFGYDLTRVEVVWLEKAHPEAVRATAKTEMVSAFVHPAMKEGWTVVESGDWRKRDTKGWRG